MSTTSHPSVSKAPRPAIATALTLLAITLLAAITPMLTLAAPTVAAQLSRQWQLSPQAIGYLFFIELGAMSLASLPAIWWLKRCDWRRVALLSGLVFIIANGLSARVDGYPDLLVLRFFSALAGGSLMIICLCSAATIAHPRRAFGCWLIGQVAAAALALNVLPLLFERYGLQACWLVLAGVGRCWPVLAGAMLAGLPLTRYFPATLPGRPSGQRRAASLAKRPVILGILGVLCFYISLSGIWTFIGTIGAQAGISTADSGKTLTFASLTAMAGTACTLLTARRIHADVLLLAGYDLMACAVALLVGQPQLVRFALAVLLFQFAWNLILPLLLTSLAKMEQPAQLMNITNLIIGAGLATGPWLAGYLIESGKGFVPLLIGTTLLVLLSFALTLGALRTRTSS